MRHFPEAVAILWKSSNFPETTEWNSSCSVNAGTRSKYLITRVKHKLKRDTAQETSCTLDYAKRRLLHYLCLPVLSTRILVLRPVSVKTDVVASHRKKKEGVKATLNKL